MRDDDDRLARVTSGQRPERRDHAAADRGEGFSSLVGEIEVAGHPAPFGLDIGVQALFAPTTAERPHDPLVQRLDDLGHQAGGTADRLGGLEGPSHRRAIQRIGPLRRQDFGHGLRLATAPLPEADVRLGAVEAVGGRRLGVAKQEDARLVHHLAPGIITTDNASVSPTAGFLLDFGLPRVAARPHYGMEMTLPRRNVAPATLSTSQEPVSLSTLISNR